MSYKAIIFDLGNVIININFLKCFEYWGEKSGIDVAKASSWFSEDDMYRKHERGEITGQQYFEYAKTSLNMDISFDDFLEGWNSIYEGSIRPTVEFMAQHQKSLKYYALSNSNALHREVWSKLFEKELSLMEKVYCSSQIGHRKPEENAYLHVLSQNKLQADQVIFVDDKQENTEAAESLGIKSLLFIDPEKTI